MALGDDVDDYGDYLYNDDENGHYNYYCCHGMSF